MDILSAFVPDTVAVVVVNYRTPDDLDGFLESYKTNMSKNVELVLVNVDPDERSMAIAEGAPARLAEASPDDHHMTVLTTKENVGYAAACNRAAAITITEVIAFFNADTRLTPGIVEECAQQLIAHDDWGVLGPKQVDDVGMITHGGILGTNEAPRQRGWMERDQGQYREVRDDAVMVMGSAYFVKRRVWDELSQCEIYREAFPGVAGAFLPTPHYYEESGCSYHAGAHGWKNVYYGLATMIHRWHKASPVGGSADRHFETSREIFRRFCDLHGIAHD